MSMPDQPLKDNISLLLQSPPQGCFAASQPSPRARPTPRDTLSSAHIAPSLPGPSAPLSFSPKALERTYFLQFTATDSALTSPLLCPLHQPPSRPSGLRCAFLPGIPGGQHPSDPRPYPSLPSAVRISTQTPEPLRLALYLANTISPH